jgi:hypothetical protein
MFDSSEKQLVAKTQEIHEEHIKNKTMVVEYAFSKISRRGVRNGQEGVCNYIYLHIDV